LKDFDFLRVLCVVSGDDTGLIGCARKKTDAWALPSSGKRKASAPRTACSKKKKTVAEYLWQGLTAFTQTEIHHVTHSSGMG